MASIKSSHTQVNNYRWETSDMEVGRRFAIEQENDTNLYLMGLSFDSLVGHREETLIVLDRAEAERLRDLLGKVLSDWEARHVRSART